MIIPARALPRPGACRARAVSGVVPPSRRSYLPTYPAQLKMRRRTHYFPCSTP